MISLHMSRFLTGYLLDIYRLFDGDLAIVIVLAEIAHHNTTHHFTEEGGLKEELKGGIAHAKVRRQLLGCNAFSMAEATGMPRETIRRKIARLEALGWVVRGERREVRITPKIGETFLPDCNVKLMNGLLETARRIQRLLDKAPAAAK